ncbi:multiple sugar transport system permease protein/sn-glycerol 3-phosphate transport system permease protein [Sulfitobacter undariae]|uniref:Multiple sugar transport system permease protein/sn-glycerol 3-phosphate transport system permease protein n=1 Tax=Sulfitobacter undariae TaxID=1563671 RepID=A0A7W6E729_9RHOB|nr:carbohydrate ABC transporter permease [Sulfitobacter undariae]MBB3995947.1 multiple sugar transport system permease protein/sn-glycerol 3-phosphate transport system permease protein [Sulfitobacter undariae]
MKVRTALGASAATHIVLSLVAILSVFPLFWMVTTAFTPNDLALTKAFRFWPEDPTFENFRIAFTDFHAANWIWNSILIAVLVSVGKLAIAVPAGFAFSHMQFRGRDALFWVIVATMTFPTIIGIVPLYIGISLIGWYDTQTAVIVPSIAYIGFYVFFMRQIFRSLPNAMFEAARLDNAGPFKQLFEIAIPNVLPAIASLSIISFLGAWNIYLWALLVLDTPEKRTLAIGLKSFVVIDDFEPMWGPMMAVALLSILPVMILFIFAQRYVMAAFTGGIGK